MQMNDYFAQLLALLRGEVEDAVFETFHPAFKRLWAAAFLSGLPPAPKGNSTCAILCPIEETVTLEGVTLTGPVHRVINQAGSDPRSWPMFVTPRKGINGRKFIVPHFEETRREYGRGTYLRFLHYTFNTCPRPVQS
jgi:hypothetical protein